MVMIVVAVVIIFFQVNPSFMDVKQIQKNIETYKTERDRIVAVNSKLSELMTQMDSVSTDDTKRLLTFLPPALDELRVSRDLLLISRKAGTLYKNVEYGGQSAEAIQTTNTDAGGMVLEGHQFTLSVEGTYDQIKRLFYLLEQNDYPFSIQQVDLQRADGGFLSVTIDMITFAFHSDLSNT